MSHTRERAAFTSEPDTYRDPHRRIDLALLVLTSRDIEPPRAVHLATRALLGATSDDLAALTEEHQSASPERAA